MTFTLKSSDKTMKERSPAHNSRFAKAGVSCFYDNEVLNSSFVHLMKFSAKNSPPSQSGKTSDCLKYLFTC